MPGKAVFAVKIVTTRRMNVAEKIFRRVEIKNGRKEGGYDR